MEVYWNLPENAYRMHLPRTSNQNMTNALARAMGFPEMKPQRNCREYPGLRGFTTNPMKAERRFDYASRMLDDVPLRCFIDLDEPDVSEEVAARDPGSSTGR